MQTRVARTLAGLTAMVCLLAGGSVASWAQEPASCGSITVWMPDPYNISTRSFTSGRIALTMTPGGLVLKGQATYTSETDPSSTAEVSTDLAAQEDNVFKGMYHTTGRVYITDRHASDADIRDHGPLEIRPDWFRVDARNRVVIDGEAFVSTGQSKWRAHVEIVDRCDPTVTTLSTTPSSSSTTTAPPATKPTATTTKPAPVTTAAIPPSRTLPAAPARWATPVFTG